MSEHDPLDIHSQEEKQKDRKIKEKHLRDIEEEDIKWLMGKKRGRRIIWRLLEGAGVFRLSFNATAMQMAFNEGNRNYGLNLLNTIHISCHELYPVMIRENYGNADDGRAPNQ